MRHYITFEDNTEGNKEWNQFLKNGVDAEDVEFTEVERGGGDPPLHPEEKWVSQYFSSSTPISEGEEYRLKSLPGVIDWDFNREQ